MEATGTSIGAMGRRHTTIDSHKGDRPPGVRLILTDLVGNNPPFYHLRMGRDQITSNTTRRTGARIGLVLGALIVIGVLIWQGVTSNGAPDPTAPHTSPTVAVLDIGVLVFREGLECILVLSAVTASMTGAQQVYRRPIASGAAIAFGATLLTWWGVVGFINSLTGASPRWISRR